MADQQYLEQLARKLIDEGRMIEAGWLSLRRIALPHDASPQQVDAMRMAFMAGAQHVFASMIAMLEPGRGATRNDLRRLDQIGAELRRFHDEMTLRLRQPGGHA